MYPAELVKPMREDLTNVGFEELHTTDAVDAALAKEGTTLVVVNSVCGCAAANARPAANKLAFLRLFWLKLNIIIFLSTEYI